MQRAGLLEAVAADLYGENRLVADGLLPAGPVAASPAWLRPLVGVRPASGHWLHFLAFDVARGPDGRWRVLRDRTDSPAGAGTALETRLATQRVFQELFQDSHVHRLAGFFRAFRNALAGLDRVGGGRVGMLTSGPGGPNYFEHAYLARYLGFMLFEGEDIAVENGAATVRTVAGPRPLGVVWRRLRAGRADPLELDETSGAGVPGLVSAIREGALSAVNALGSGVLEDPALAPFLPGIAESRGGPPPGAPEGWWAAQAEAAPLSTAPVWTDGALRAEPVVLRLFLARTPEGWRAMPGGYARLGGVPAQDPGAVADIWVVSDEPVPVDTMAVRPSDAYVRPLPGTLPSRAADNLFWLGRYVERAEAAIRLLRALHLRMAETGARDNPLLASLRDYLRELPLDPGEAVPQGLLGTLDSALICASRVHDRFSIDGWTALRNLTEAAEEMARTARAGDDTARIMTALLHRLGWPERPRPREHVPLYRLALPHPRAGAGAGVRHGLGAGAFRRPGRAGRRARPRHGNRRLHHDLPAPLFARHAAQHGGGPHGVRHHEPALGALPAGPDAKPDRAAARRGDARGDVAARPRRAARPCRHRGRDAGDGGQGGARGACGAAGRALRPRLRGLSHLSAMAVLYDIALAIRQHYDAPAAASRQTLRLLPPTLAGGQHVVAAAVDVSPPPAERRDRRDFFRNMATDLAFAGAHEEVVYSLAARVRREAGQGALPDSPPPAALAEDMAAIRSLAPDAPHHFLAASPRLPEEPEFAAYARAALPAGAGAAEAVEAVGLALHRDMAFDADATEVDTPALEAFRRGRGVCQDFTHAMIACLRALGIPAGYVSGFLRTDPPPGQPRLQGRMRCTPGCVHGAGRRPAGWNTTRPMPASPATAMLRLRAAATIPTWRRSRAYSAAPAARPAATKSP